MMNNNENKKMLGLAGIFAIPACVAALYKTNLMMSASSVKSEEERQKLLRKVNKCNKIIKNTTIAGIAGLGVAAAYNVVNESASDYQENDENFRSRRAQIDKLEIDTMTALKLDLSDDDEEDIIDEEN